MKLTTEQKEILAYVLTGCSTVEMAARLEYSPASVKRRLKEIFDYFKVSSKVELASKVLKMYADAKELKEKSLLE